jgi:putative tryptophan/tyrosine transport system substrate-binding protein
LPTSDLKLACETKRHLPQGRVSTAMIEFAAWCHRPAVYPDRHFIAAGGLMSYGVEPTDLYRRAADYIDSILKGERPGDLPVQNPRLSST